MKITWLSANLLGYELLKESIKLGFDIDSVITLDKNSSTVMYDSVEDSKWDELGIKVHRVDKLNEETDLLKSLSPDLVIMCGWRQIIDEKTLKIPKEGFVGFHPTLLPKGRGPAPIINSILNDFKDSGLTMFYVSEGLDDGDIIGQESFTIEDIDYSQDVYDKIIEAGKKLVKKHIPLLQKSKAARVKQDENKATVFEKLSLKDNKIDLEEPLENSYRKIRALSKPYNGAYIEKNNKKLIIWKAELE